MTRAHVRLLGPCFKTGQMKDLKNTPQIIGTYSQRINSRKQIIKFFRKTASSVTKGFTNKSTVRAQRAGTAITNTT